MDCAVITTYRCNARCQMCHIWQNPSRTSEEFPPTLLEKLPDGIGRLNITGGEAFLRADIEDIVAVLSSKTSQVEISTNGRFTDRIVKLATRFPDTIFRISVEGLPRLNDGLRGIDNGFDHALRSLLRLREMGIRNVGFGIVISDRNAADLLDLHTLCSSMGIEFAQATMHNSFYFHKHDNVIQDTDFVVAQLQEFVRRLLRSNRGDPRLRVKDWFRAYINMGLMNYIQGKTRPLPCGAGTESFFMDPWGKVLACNGSADPLVMGDLHLQDFEEIWCSERAEEVRGQVRRCTRNCWMTGTAVPAMRTHPWAPVRWVLENKLRLLLGRDVVFGA